MPLSASQMVLDFQSYEHGPKAFLWHGWFDHKRRNVNLQGFLKSYCTVSTLFPEISLVNGNL